VIFLNLEQYLDTESIENSETSLPIFHTTLFEYALGIFESGISPRLCNKFDTDLVYLFYGRGSYSKDGLSRIDFLRENDLKLAVSFGINLSSLDEAKLFNTFPFDSGAFIDNRYQPYLSSSEDIHKFNLHFNQINKYLNHFFGSNKNYIEGMVNETVTIPDELASFYNLLQDRITAEFDTRVRTIEISTKEHILPQEFKFLCIHIRLKSNSHVKKLLELNETITPIFYDTLEIGHEQGMYSYLQMKIKEYIKEHLL